MNRTPDPGSHGDSPVVELGERGPRGESGFLLRAPRLTEALVWDLENEIVSARRHWVPEENAWWIAMSYFDTVLNIVLRLFPAVRVRYDTRDERILFADGEGGDTTLRASSPDGRIRG